MNAREWFYGPLGFGSTRGSFPAGPPPNREEVKPMNDDFDNSHDDRTMLEKLRASTPPLRRNQRHPDLVPVPMPPREKLNAALLVMDQQQLAVYQRLYRIGLTSPGIDGTPFAVRRSLEHSGCVEVSPHRYPQYRFLVLPNGDDADLAGRKAEALFQAINLGLPKKDPRACCPVAEITGCVCTISFKCLVHGARCHGTHD